MWYIQINAEKIEANACIRTFKIYFLHDADDPPPSSTEEIKQILLGARFAIPREMNKLQIVELNNTGKRITDK